MGTVTSLPLLIDFVPVDEVLAQPDGTGLILIIRGILFDEPPDLPFLEGETLPQWRVRRRAQLAQLREPVYRDTMEKVEAAGAVVVNSSPTSCSVVCHGTVSSLRGLLERFPRDRVCVSAYRT